MVFETSCWATAINDRQMMIDNNSVQRHQKIDYFDPNSVKAATPIISHISSNGYYGYCPIPYKNANDTNDFAMHDAIVDVPDDSMMHAEPTESGHQGQTIDRRKRTNQCNDDQYSAFETKKSRIGCSDCIEGLYFCIIIVSPSFCFCFCELQITIL